MEPPAKAGAFPVKLAPGRRTPPLAPSRWLTGELPCEAAFCCALAGCGILAGLLLRLPSLFRCLASLPRIAGQTHATRNTQHATSARTPPASLPFSKKPWSDQLAQQATWRSRRRRGKAPHRSGLSAVARLLDHPEGPPPPRHSP